MNIEIIGCDEATAKAVQTKLSTRGFAAKTEGDIVSELVNEIRELNNLSRGALIEKMTVRELAETLYGDRK